jgi:plasmid stabilization system protein ParE
LLVRLSVIPHADGWPVTRIELAPEVLDDFDRFLEHQARFDVDDTPHRLTEIVKAIQVLADHPLIGRKTSRGNRELIIGRDSRGYVALYRYVPQLDTVFVLAIRSQGEKGYKRGP